MAIRDAVFTVGPEQSTVPTATTPTDSNDFVSLGYLNNASYWGGAVADYTAVRALTSVQRADRQVRFVDAGAGELWVFDTNSAAVDDGLTILTPDDAPANGRWLIVSSGGGGGGSGAAGVESLKSKTEQEHYGVIAPDLDNSVASSFYSSKQTVNGVFLADHTSGTSVYLAWNSIYLSDSDKNTDSTTSWTAVGAGTTLTTSVTKRLGANSLQYDKAGTATEAGIRFDRASQNMGLNSNLELFFWINLPSLVNLTDVYAKIYADTTSNYQKFTTTTDASGSALASGWNLIKFDISTGGSATGTGWDKSKLSRYTEVGVDASSGQVYTAILIDAVNFSIYQPSKLIRANSEYTIYDTSNVVDFIIAHNSAAVSGPVTLSASLATAFSGGTSSTIVRNLASISGDNAARMTNGLSGNAVKTQAVRLQKILPASLSSSQFKAFVNTNTNMFFEVLTVPGTTSITVDDPANSSANIVSGTTMHVFKVHYNCDGQKNYEYRSLDLAVTSSSWGSSILTINNSGTNAGVAIGDVVVLKVQDTKLSLIAPTGANVNYQTPTLDDIIITDLGLGYPYSDKTYAHWTLSNSTGNKIVRGSLGKDLTIGGTPTTNYAFKNGQLASGNFSSANYFTLTNAETANLSGVGSSVEISFWFYATAFTGSTRALFSRTAWTSNTGWYVYLNSTTNDVGINNVVGTLNLYLSFSPTTWTHVVARIESGVSSYIYVNGTKSTTSALTYNTSLGDFYIGKGDVSSPSWLPATGVQIADVLINYNSTALTAGQIESLYNRGLHRILGFRPGIDYRYSQTALSGQQLDIKSTISRTTEAASPFIGSMGLIKA